MGQIVLLYIFFARQPLQSGIVKAKLPFRQSFIKVPWLWNMDGNKNEQMSSQGQLQAFAASYAKQPTFPKTDGNKEES